MKFVLFSNANQIEPSGSNSPWRLFAVTIIVLSGLYGASGYADSLVLSNPSKASELASDGGADTGGGNLILSQNDVTIQQVEFTLNAIHAQLPWMFNQLANWLQLADDNSLLPVRPFKEVFRVLGLKEVHARLKRLKFVYQPCFENKKRVHASVYGVKPHEICFDTTAIAGEFENAKIDNIYKYLAGLAGHEAGHRLGVMDKEASDTLQLYIQSSSSFDLADVESHVSDWIFKFNERLTELKQGIEQAKFNSADTEQAETFSTAVCMPIAELADTALEIANSFLTGNSGYFLSPVNLNDVAAFYRLLYKITLLKMACQIPPVKYPNESLTYQSKALFLPEQDSKNLQKMFGPDFITWLKTLKPITSAEDFQQVLESVDQEVKTLKPIVNVLKAASQQP